MIIPQENVPLPGNTDIWYVRFCNIQNQTHWHDEAEMILVRSGVIDILINGITYKGQSGDAFLCEGGDIHTIISDGPSELDFLIFTKNIFRDGNRFHIESPYLPSPKGFDGQFDRIIEQIKAPDAFGKRVLYNLIENIVFDSYRINGYTVRNSDSGNLTLSNYRNLIDYIDQKYATVDFAEAAKFMAYSPAYFSRIFTSLCGTTFTRYLNTVRIEKSLPYITSGACDISKLALDCGFGSVRHYNRVFRELTGYTPTTLPSDFSFRTNFRKSSDSIFNPNLKGYKRWEYMI